MESTHLIRLFNDKVRFRLLGIKHAINSKQRVKIPIRGRFATYGARRPFLVKNINVVLYLQYHIFYPENICIANIWRAFDYKSISKSFIHCLLRYEPRFLGWASCPMLPYIYIYTHISCISWGTGSADTCGWPSLFWHCHNGNKMSLTCKTE